MLLSKEELIEFVQTNVVKSGDRVTSKQNGLTYVVDHVVISGHDLRIICTDGTTHNALDIFKNEYNDF